MKITAFGDLIFTTRDLRQTTNEVSSAFERGQPFCGIGSIGIDGILLISRNSRLRASPYTVAFTTFYEFLERNCKSFAKKSFRFIL